MVDGLMPPSMLLSQKRLLIFSFPPTPVSRLFLAFPLFFIFLTLSATSTKACFSLGGKEKRHLPSSSLENSLSSAENAEDRRKSVNGADASTRAVISREAESEEQSGVQLTDKFVKAYLHEYGYLNGHLAMVDENGDEGGRIKEGGEEWNEGNTEGIRLFQQFIGLKPATGELTPATSAMMLQHRCENRDIEPVCHSAEEHPPPPQPLRWRRNSLTYSIEGTPSTSELSELDMRELIRQAFSAWEIVISMDFVEIAAPSSPTAIESSTTNRSKANNSSSSQLPSHADIEFIFVDEAIVPQPKWHATATASVTQPASPQHQPSHATEEKEVELVVQTGLGVASATPPPHRSQIVISRHRPWATFQVQEAGGRIDIFLVLIHQIGHALGLAHSNDRKSVMFPVFEREVGEQLPVISNDDVDNLRMLYAPNEVKTKAARPHGGEEGKGASGGKTPPIAPTTESEKNSVDSTPKAVQQKSPSPSPNLTLSQFNTTTTAAAKNNNNDGSQAVGKAAATAKTTKQDKEAEKEKGSRNSTCPTTMETATQVGSRIFIFDAQGMCWQFDSSTRKIQSTPSPITELFPDAPTTLGVAVTSGSLTVLLGRDERTLHGYVWTVGRRRNAPAKTTGRKGLDKREEGAGGYFQPAAGFPKQLHNRVLFYPDAAFPLHNGSVVLIKDNVFAVYDLRSNEPSLLGDLATYFPHLPRGLRSGLPLGRRTVLHGGEVIGDGGRSTTTTLAPFTLASSYYHMMTRDEVFLYNMAEPTAMRLFKEGEGGGGGDNPISLSEFLNCSKNSNSTA